MEGQGVNKASFSRESILIQKNDCTSFNYGIKSFFKFFKHDMSNKNVKVTVLLLASISRYGET